MPKPTPRRAVARPTKGLGNGYVGAGNDPLWVGLRPTPVFQDSPLRPSQRRVELQLDPRRAQWTDASALETLPRGSGSARRQRSWIHHCAQANAASSCSSTHEGPREWMRRRWKRSPVGRAPPDASVPGFTAAPKPTPRRAAARPTKSLVDGCVGAGNDPPWVELCSTRAFLDALRRPWREPPRTDLRSTKSPAGSNELENRSTARARRPVPSRSL